MNNLHSRYSKSSGSQEPPCQIWPRHAVAVQPTKTGSTSLKASSLLFRTGKQPMLYTSQIKGQRWSQETNPLILPNHGFPISPFQKNILSLGKNQLGLSMVQAATLESRIPELLLLLLAREASHPHGSLLSLSFSLPHYLNHTVLFSNFPG